MPKQPLSDNRNPERTPYTLLRREVEIDAREIADALAGAQSNEQADVLMRIAIDVATWPELHGTNEQAQCLAIAEDIPNECRADIAQLLETLAAFIRSEIE
jgi:hypothetical protein